MKKGQVSLIIIIGLIILIISALVITKIFTDKKNKIVTELPDFPWMEPVQAHIDLCLAQELKEALYVLGRQGMIYPDAYIYSKNTKIAYFHFRGKDYLPEKERLEDEISQYVEEGMGTCITDFAKDGYLITEMGKKIEADTVFDEDSVDLSIRYPIEIFFEGDIVDAADFKTRARARMPLMIQTSQEIIKNMDQQGDWIDIDDLKELELETILTKIDEDTLIFEMIDKEYGIDGQPFRYRFAVKLGS